jgi:hypothetical protein
MAEAPEPTILPPATELAATEPVLPPTQVDYSALDTKALDAAIVKSLEIASHYARQFDAEKKAHLLPALMEMETRWNKKQGARSDLSQLPIQGKWHDYLRHCGVKPSTYRGWKKGYYDAIALMSPQLGGESASLPSSDVLTSVQKEVVSALVDQGYRQSDALALVKTVTGDTFAELFTNCLANRLKAADRQKQSAPAGDAQTEPVPVTAEPVDSQSKAGATPEAVKLGAESPRYEESQQPVSDDVTVQPPQPPAILPVAREAKADSVTPEEFETVLGAVPVLEVQALKDETSARIKEIKPWIEEQLARLQHDAKADANACKTKYIGDAIDTFVSRLASGFNGPSFQKTLTARDKRTYPDDLRHVAETLRRGGWMLLSMARNMAQVSAEEQPEEHAPANDTEPDSDAQEQSPCPESVTTQSSTEKAVETSAEAETQEPPVQSVPKKKPVKASTAKPIKADGVTAKPGYLCKFQGTDWESWRYPMGTIPTATLIRMGDGKEVGSVPVSELRYVRDPDAMASESIRRY